MSDQSDRYTRLRHTATGALAALVAIGAVAGTTALAAKSQPKSHGDAAVMSGSKPEAPAPGPDKTQAPHPPVNHQPFLNAIQQLVNDGTISAAQGQVVDREIQASRVDTDTLASSGFTQSQLQAVAQALGNAKRAVAGSVGFRTAGVAYQRS